MSELNNLETTRTLGDILVEILPALQKPLGRVETLTMTWEQRSRPRRRCTTDAGTVLALTLPRGTVLTDGLLILNNPIRTVIVKAEPEDVVVVKPADKLEMCTVAHHLGNWHRSFQLVDDGTMLIEPDAPLVSWLDAQKIKHSNERRPYHPNLKGNAHD